MQQRGLVGTMCSWINQSENEYAEIEILGQEDLTVKNIVFDFNGTLATDGKLKNSHSTVVFKIKKI